MCHDMIIFAAHIFAHELQASMGLMSFFEHFTEISCAGQY